MPALLVGVLSALILWILEQAADLLGGVLYKTMPGALGVDPSGWWIILVLTLTGLAVGITLTVLPGHGGPDSATTELMGPPLPLKALPGLALVDHPEPRRRCEPRTGEPHHRDQCRGRRGDPRAADPEMPTQLAVLLAGASTIGALFGTPVAAALLFTACSPP